MRQFQAVPYDDKTEVDLSPMLDVIFIMLIFFIITATFIKEDGLPVALPGDLIPGPQGVETISVTVEPNGNFLVNGRVLSSDSVRPYVYALHAENPEASFIVLLAEGSVVRDAAVAIEAGRSIGLDVVPIASEESLTQGLR